MRRTFGAILLALGVALLALGFLAKPLIYDKLTTVALDQKSTSISQGDDMSVLRVWGEEAGTNDDGTPKIQAHYDKLTGVTVKSTRTVFGIPGAVPATDREKDALWQTGVSSEVVGVGQLTKSIETVTFDRHTGLTTGSDLDQKSVGDLAESDKMAPVKHEGLFFKFPFNVQKQSYPFWDGDLGKAVDINFVREENLFGADTYVFQQVIPFTELEPRTLPAGVFDQTGDDVTATPTYSNTRTLWIEPNTGVIIKGQEVQAKTLVSQAGTVITTKGTIGYSEDTVKENAKLWGGKGRLLGILGGSIKPIGIIAGLLGIAGGLLLLLTGAKPAAAAPTTRRTTPAAPVGGVSSLGVGGADTRRGAKP